MAYEAQRVNSEGKTLDTALFEELEALSEELSRSGEGCLTLTPLNPLRVVVALSGGRDSMTLLDVVSRLFHRPGQHLLQRVRAIYIHHGLSTHASEWEAHCELECARRRIPFESIHVTVNRSAGGVEAAAREARYRALEGSALAKGDDAILTAHHADDRLETFLIQWLRGAGPDGLATFPTCRRVTLNDGADKRLYVVRPWATIPRYVLEGYATEHRLTWVEDESNTDPHYDRNRLRHNVLPTLLEKNERKHEGALDSIQLIQEMVEVVQDVAQSDCAQLSQKDGRMLALEGLLALESDRQAWCLRTWLHQLNITIPTQSQLTDFIEQIKATTNDTALALDLGDWMLRKGGQYLYAVKKDDWTVPDDQPIAIQALGDLPLPQWQATLVIREAQPNETGVSLRWLSEQTLMVGAKRNGLKMKPHPLRPTKPLKDLFASAGIPSFLRESVPVIYRDNEPLWVAGLGWNLNLVPEAALKGEGRVVLELGKTQSLLALL